jgi:hypothetical protein
MGQGFVAGDVTILAAQGAGRCTAGRGQGSKAGFGQHAGRASVPRIGHQQCARLVVEVAKTLGFG